MCESVAASIGEGDILEEYGAGGGVGGIGGIGGVGGAGGVGGLGGNIGGLGGIGAASGGIGGGKGGGVGGGAGCAGGCCSIPRLRHIQMSWSISCSWDEDMPMIGRELAYLVLFSVCSLLLFSLFIQVTYLNSDTDLKVSSYCDPQVQRFSRKGNYRLLLRRNLEIMSINEAFV
ncbi:hypothetical protein POM88_030202 [Heracleum sosnowskyi]|uniref:Uncharacterized protein n=1 Tax=Heracleum sosnowskyi TaxID=360622 RepID=A0AAD8HWB5_9APIA|nr:hypothetical protein POM88_030202 [Heracleum sosnowskyi]